MADPKPRSGQVRAPGRSRSRCVAEAVELEGAHLDSGERAEELDAKERRLLHVRALGQLRCVGCTTWHNTSSASSARSRHR